MKLGIISDCIHYHVPGGVGTENHILLRQLEALAAHFSETLICCPFGTYDNSKVVSTYAPSNIHFHPLPVVGGNTISDKFAITKTVGKWFKGYKEVNRFSDIVYQRFPNNVNLPGFFYFRANNKKVFATYTGTWSGYDREPLTYRLQRWLLKNYFKGPVWAYTNHTCGNKVFAGTSPSYSINEWDEETGQVTARIASIRSKGLTKFRLISVGALINYKNQACIIEACALLKQRAFPFSLTIVGDGPMKAELEQMITDRRLDAEVQMAGKKGYDELRALYRQHDFVVQSPLSEGFGKVPVEGLFHGAIPVINNLSMAAYITGENERGFLFDAAKPANLAATLINISKQTHRLPDMICNGRVFAQRHTVEQWAQEYYDTIKHYYGKA